MSNDFNCEQLEPLLSAYHDGELNDAERALAERHLNACGACQSCLLQIDAVASSLKALPRLNPKTDVAANIEQLIAKQPKGVTKIQRPVIWGAAGIAAAAAVLLVAGNFRVAPNSASNPLVANSNVTHSIAKPESESVKAEVLEIAQAPDSSLSPLQQKPTDHVQFSAGNHEHGSVSTGSGAKKDSATQDQHQKPSTENNAKKNSKFNPHIEVASLGNESATLSGGTTSGSHLKGSDAQLIANRKGGTGTIGADSNLVAVYDTEQRGVTEELGITTDEDGLYAIKL